jgi:translation initiation factor 6
MHIKKSNFKSFSSIGIFCSVSDKVALIPLDSSTKFENLVKDVFEVEPIKASLGESNLLGTISKIYKKKVIVSTITTDKEIDYLTENGLKVLRLNSYHAVGNLMGVNKNALLLGKSILEADKKSVSKFFDIPYTSFNICNTDLVGSVSAITDKAFAVGSSVSEKEFEKMKELFKVEGNVATVNYGDAFIANGMLVNTKGLMVGEGTTGYELMRLDEIFRD